LPPVTKLIPHPLQAVPAYHLSQADPASLLSGSGAAL